jgi:ATP-dependent DNA helicase RecQ
MKNIAFFDTEVSMKTKKIVDFGAIKSSGEWIHEDNLSRLIDFLLSVDFICGHNIIHHDLKYLDTSVTKANKFLIDTLYLSALLFPQQPYHRLVKDDKLQIEELNNPLNDAKKARVLFYDEVEAYHKLPLELKRIFYTLLNNQNEFRGFFKFLDFSEIVTDICGEI